MSKKYERLGKERLVHRSKGGERLFVIIEGPHPFTKSGSPDHGRLFATSWVSRDTQKNLEVVVQGLSSEQ